MKKGAHKGLYLCLIFGFAFIILTVARSTYSGDRCIIPTVTSEVTDPFPRLKWDQSNPDTVARNTCVIICVENGLPPFTWTVDGNGFYFDFGSGVTTVTVNQQCVSLCADENSCGSSIVTVQDAYGDIVTGSLRDPDHGYWVLIEDISCGNLDPGPYCECHSNYYCVQGAYKYLDSWLAGNLMGTRWHPSGNCTKYPCTPYDRNYCYCVGYYPKKYHVGIHYKKKWKWECP